MFDLKVTHRNPKTGAVVGHDPYRMRTGKGGKTFERPINSGNLFYEDGSAAGRWEDDKFIKGAEHKAYAMPLSKDEKVQAAFSEKDSKIAKLEQDLRDLELKSIEAEKIEMVEEKVSKPVSKKALTKEK